MNLIDHQPRHKCAAVLGSDPAVRFMGPGGNRGEPDSTGPRADRYRPHGEGGGPLLAARMVC